MITIDFNRIKIEPNDKILDIGCGSGRHIMTMSKNKNVTIVASDLNFNVLKLAKKQLNINKKYLKRKIDVCNLLLTDIKSLPFRNNYFDLIICTEVLEHIYNDQLAINELVRILKPGKKLILSVPRYFPEKICWLISDKYTSGNQKHIRIYRKNNLLSKLKFYNLFCYDIHYAHSFHTPFWWLKCLCGLKKNEPFIVKYYHKFLIWDIMKNFKTFKIIDKILNPILGKSMVLYMTKKK